jgi:acetyl esterase
MPLDPQVKALLSGLAEVEAPPISEQSAEEARLAGAVLGQLSVPEEVGSVEDRTIAGPAGDLSVRIYRAEQQGGAPQPVMVWFHGGGFVIGSVETADGMCRALCRRSGVAIVSVDYRLAPEAPFPAGPDDCLAAFDWVRQHAGDLGFDVDRIAVGGDSAGGNLAIVTALARRGRVAFQLLVYPVTDLTMTSESYQANGEGYLLTADTMRWFAEHYTTDAEQRHDPRLSPLFADDLTGSPPTFIMTAEFDPLRDEGEAYGKRLVDAGVPVQIKRYDGMIHAFLQMSAVLDATGPALDDAATALRDALA